MHDDIVSTDSHMTPWIHKPSTGRTQTYKDREQGGPRELLRLFRVVFQGGAMRVVEIHGYAGFQMVCFRGFGHGNVAFRHDRDGILSLLLFSSLFGSQYEGRC